MERAGVDRGSPWWLCPVGGGVAWTLVEWRWGLCSPPLPGPPLLALPCRRPGPPSVPALLTPHVLGSVLCPALSPWRAGVTSGHCSPRGRRRGFDEQWSSGRKAVAWWRGLGVLRMALRGPALLGCWDPLRSSHRSSPWRLWAGAEVVLTGGAEVTTRNPQRLWMRAGVLTRAALWPEPRFSWPCPHFLPALRFSSGHSPPPTLCSPEDSGQQVWPGAPVLAGGQPGGRGGHDC